MKTLFAISVLAAALLLAGSSAFAAAAQTNVFTGTTTTTPTPATAYGGGIQVNTLDGSTGTNCIVAAATTNTYTKEVFFVGKATRPTLQLAFKSGGANAANEDFSFDASLDAAVWQTNVFTLRAVGAGTGYGGVITNLPSNLAFPYLRLNTIAHTNAATYLTNVTVKVWAPIGF